MEQDSGYIGTEHREFCKSTLTYERVSDATLVLYDVEMALFGDQTEEAEILRRARNILYARQNSF